MMTKLYVDPKQSQLYFPQVIHGCYGVVFRANMVERVLTCVSLYRLATSNHVIDLYTHKC